MIVKATGPVPFTVKPADGNTVRWHQDHLQKRSLDISQRHPQSSEECDDTASEAWEDMSVPDGDTPSKPSESVTETVESDTNRDPPPSPPLMDHEPTTLNTTPGNEFEPIKVYQQCIRRAPDYYGT